MRSKKFLKSVRNEKGITLVVTLLMIAVLVVLGTIGIMGANMDIKISRNYVDSQKALYDAEAGVGQVLAALRSTSFAYPNAAGTYTEITLNRPTGFKFDYDRIKIYYVADGLYKFEMTGKGDNNSEKKIEVVISRTSSLPAGSDGAVGMYGNDPAITCSGSCSIDGHDWDRPPIDCNGASCRPSVAGPGPDVAGLYTSETAADGASASGNITGNALYGSPNWQQGGGANTEETWVNFVNRILSGTYNDASDNVFGTRAAPTIVVASEDLHIASNGNHAGILIINNVDFQFTGTPVWEGLIILVGDNAKFGAGNANLYGSLITINHPEGTTAVTTGNGGLNYSSAALKNLEKIPGMTGAKIVSWRDLSID